MVTKKSVLVVEDDYFVRDIYRTKFSQEGFDVRVAEDGIQALKEVENGVVDFILLDVIMPAMDGFEVLKRLKENPKWKDIPVILLTNLSQKEDLEKGMQNGVREYLIKSQYTPSEVVAKVRSLMKE